MSRPWFLRRRRPFEVTPWTRLTDRWNGSMWAGYPSKAFGVLMDVTSWAVTVWIAAALVRAWWLPSLPSLRWWVAFALVALVWGKPGRVWSRRD